MEVLALLKIIYINSNKMKTQNLTNTGNLNYSFIPVPTQLFILLDYRLKLVLTALIQVSGALANSNGWFYYSKDDLKKVCGLKSDKTIIAAIETLYRLNIVEVQSRTFKNNISTRTANYYRLNVSEIEKYNEYSVYECLNIPELQIPMLNYTAKDYKTTYTAATATVQDNTISSPTSDDNNETRQLPIKEVENTLVALETSNPAIKENTVQSEPIEDEVLEDCPLTLDELKENNINIKTLSECEEVDEFKFLDDDEEKELKIAETPIAKEDENLKKIEKVEVDEKIVETASVFPTDLQKVEKRNLSNDRTEKLDDTVKQKCEELVKRYKEMTIPSSSKSAEMCNSANLYIIKQYNQGKIDIETKDTLVRELVCERFKKFPI